MRWQILATVTEDVAELERLLSKSTPGWSIFYHLEKDVFFHFGYGGCHSLLTPSWRRSLPNKQQFLYRILQNLRHGETRPVRVKDFRQIFKALKALQRSGSSLSRAFLLPDRLLFWQHVANQEQYRTISLTQLNKLLQQERLSLEEAYINQTAATVVWPRAIDDFFYKIKKQIPKAPAILYAHEFAAAAALLYALGWHWQTLLVLAEDKEWLQRSLTLPAVRHVLVLTNIESSDLPFLRQNLEFWSKGISGFSWKHIYGKIDQVRLSRAFQKRYDLIIYRGHAELKEGKLWVAQGNFFLTRLPAPLFLHLACTAFLPPADLTHLPTRWNFLPAFRLLDFADSDLTTELLLALRTGGALATVLAKLKNTSFLLVRQ